jgi:hypothetical protein
MEVKRPTFPVEDGIPSDQAYALHGEGTLGLVINHENGSQEIGRHAAAAAIAAIAGIDREPKRPQDSKTGIVYRHEDGAIDTGTRAIRNAARTAAGREPKKYKRTYIPVK